MKLLHLKVVLAAIDADESSVQTLRAAHDLATAAGAKLHAVHAVADTGKIPRAGEHGVRELFQRADVSRSAAPLEIIAGEPIHVIRSFADRVTADVIVLGEHRGRRTPPPSIGSTALGVVTNSWAPCLVVSSPMRLPLERVLVPVDLSTTSRGALVAGLSWASALRKAAKSGRAAGADTATLTALVVDATQGASSRQPLEDALEALRRDAGTWAGVDVRGEVVGQRDVPRAIAEFAAADRSDLVVLGTRGLGTGAVGRVGSVALGVMRRLDVPLLLVPPAVWESHA